jgi:hypothetical protein
LRLYFLLNQLSLLAFLVFEILSEQRVNSGSTAAITAGGGFLVPDRPPAAGPTAASATNEQNKDRTSRPSVKGLIRKKLRRHAGHGGNPLGGSTGEKSLERGT